MFSEVFCQLLLLWAVYMFQDVLGGCERPAWATVGPDLTPEELQQSFTKEPSNISICKICHYLTGWGLSKGCLEVIYFSSKVALLIVICSSVFYLLSKPKEIKTIMPYQAMIQTSTISVSTQVDEEYRRNMIIKMETDIHQLKKYMKQVVHRENKCRKKRRNKSIEEM